MLVKAAVFLSVVFAGCASGVPPQYRTYHGFSVYGPAYSRAEVELATHAVLLAANAPDRKNQFRHCTIEYVEGPFECSASVSGLCAGMHWPTRCRLLVSRLGDCVAASATVHELVHLVAWETGAGRVEHTNQKWFAEQGSIEARAGQTAADHCNGR